MNNSNYYEVYLKRLNRYGGNYQARVQKKREEEFELYCLKSVYKVSFEFEGEQQEGTFEKYKQDETETLHYLLTKTSLNIPSGTILMLPDKDDVLKPWMIYYLEAIKASGYNRYIALKMTHFVSWTDEKGEERGSWAHLYGQENNMLKDELQSRSRMQALYAENLKLSFFIMPLNEHIKRDTYLEIGEAPFKEAYRVTGYDIHSTPGVEYVSIDPVYLRDNSPVPLQKTKDRNEEDYFWLTGGGN